MVRDYKPSPRRGAGFSGVQSPPILAAPEGGHQTLEGVACGSFLVVASASPLATPHRSRHPRGPAHLEITIHSATPSRPSTHLAAVAAVTGQGLGWRLLGTSEGGAGVRRFAGSKRQGEAPRRRWVREPLPEPLRVSPSPAQWPSRGTSPAGCSQGPQAHRRGATPTFVTRRTDMTNSLGLDL